MCIFFKSLYFQMRACERVSSHLHLIADEAAVAAEFRFRFYSSSSADLRQWSVWASMPLKTFFFCCWSTWRKNTLFCRKGKTNRSVRGSGSAGIAFSIAVKRRVEKKIKISVTVGTTHTHTHAHARGRERTPASSVLAAFGSQRLCFWSHRGKGQHYKSRFN